MNSKNMTRAYFLFLLMFTQLLLLGCKPEEVSVDPIPVDPALIGLDANWQIGYSIGNTCRADQFRASTIADQSHVIVMCHPGGGPWGYYPYIGRNMDVVTQTNSVTNWAARAGEIVMEGSNNGQYSMLRFKVPATGTYKINAVFEGVHYGLSSTDVHILHNSQSLFDALIEGYGGDASYHAITGASPVASYDETLQLNKDDVIIFAVGYGANKNHYNDTTGLIVSIDPV